MLASVIDDSSVYRDYITTLPLSLHVTRQVQCVFFFFPLFSQHFCSLHSLLAILQSFRISVLLYCFTSRYPFFQFLSSFLFIFFFLSLPSFCCCCLLLAVPTLCREESFYCTVPITPVKREVVGLEHFEEVSRVASTFL